MEKTGTEIIVETLQREGVEVVFGIPGGVSLPLFDQFYRSNFPVVLTRHEQGAAHMADGYARASGRVGVCVATSGPGATNLVTGLATAHMDSIPVVAITSQVRTDSIGSDAFQEADITGITRPITKHNYLVKDVRDLGRVLKEAFYIASSGRPGPVLVDIPVDVQRAKTVWKWEEKIEIRSYKPNTKGHPVQIKRAAEMIKEAKRPLLYVGGGTIYSGATAELRRLAEKGNIPIIWTLMANGAIPPAHDLAMGPVGMHGKYAANIAVQKCDLLIAAGARFDDRVTGHLEKFSPQSKKIHIDIDPSNISKTVRAHCPVVGDLKQVLAQLVEDIPQLDHAAWVKEIHEMDQKNPLTYKQDDALHPQYVLQELHRLTKGDAIVATGVGQHQMWSMQWYQCNSPRHFLTSGGLGTMGYGFPAALGAKFAHPEELVVCIEGDGSFQMTACELATSTHEKKPVLVIILNNYFLGMVRQWQELFYGERYSSSCLGGEKSGSVSKDKMPHPSKDGYVPDFVKLAEAQGAVGMRISKKEQVTAALEKALQEVKQRTVVLDVLIDPYEKVFPMVPAGAGLDEIIVDMA
jgi:acetolactate synthase-1/2/3 large subunit